MNNPAAAPVQQAPVPAPVQLAPVQPVQGAAGGMGSPVVFPKDFPQKQELSKKKVPAGLSINYHFLNPWAAITVRVEEKFFCKRAKKNLALHTVKEEIFYEHQKI